MLPHSPAGERAAWVWQLVADIAGGAAVPTRAELEDHYAYYWLENVYMPGVLAGMASLKERPTSVTVEAAPANEVRLVIEFADGTARRFRCVIDDIEPHHIVFQVFSPALPPTAYQERVIDRDGRSVHVRDFGGDGPLLLLWHGAGVDATIWEAVIPHLDPFRIVSQDLPGHGCSPLPRLTVSDAIADGDAVVADLGLGPPILAGLSMGGWSALHFAATRACRALVCLDGPANLDYEAMGIQPDQPGFVPDPPDVRADLASVNCPAMVVLCQGRSPDEAEWMVPFRAGLADHLTAKVPHVRLERLATGHMLVLSEPRQTAALINNFARTVRV